MFRTTLLILSTILYSDDAEKQDVLPNEPVPNQRALIERIIKIGGDAEEVDGRIILVSLFDATDNDFVLLKDLKEVRFLDCSYCKIDGSGLQHISQMKRLERLCLQDNNLKNEHLKQISNLPRLHTLWLQNTPTNDVGLRRLRNLKSLKRLYLVNTQITDNGLRHLRGLTDLEELDLGNTKITSQGIEDLKQHLPKVKIQGTISDRINTE